MHEEQLTSYRENQRRGSYFSADTLDDLLRSICSELLSNGKIVSATKGKTRELLGVTLELTNPRARFSISETRGKIFSALGELCWYLSGSDSADFMEYYLPKYSQFSDNPDEPDPRVHGAYGPRLFNRADLNQYENVVEMLRRKPSSRQAVIQIFDSIDIAEPHQDVPCTCSLQFFLRDDYLSLIVYMRSNDVYKGFPHDVFAFTMIQEIMARELGAKIGNYKHMVGSLHVYEPDIHQVQNFLSEGYQSTRFVMPAMPEGDPWPSIKYLLKYEADIRVSAETNQDLSNLESYWADIIYLLHAFRFYKSGNYDAMRNLLGLFKPFCLYSFCEDEVAVVNSMVPLFDDLMYQDEGKKHFYKLDQHATLAMLIDRLEEQAKKGTAAIPWAMPVPTFGDSSATEIATVGLNPSNREFVTPSGEELYGPQRRFYSLSSLGLSSWREIHASHLDQILTTCLNYFANNPYDRWFKVLDLILSGTGKSYYNPTNGCCHFDVIPYATELKWFDLSALQKEELFHNSRDSLGLILSNSSVRLIILNGKSVVQYFESACGCELQSFEKEEWTLSRSHAKGGVMGVGYHGYIDTYAGIDLQRSIKVLGFNHNLQSSFGVSKKVLLAIRDWVTTNFRKVEK